MSVAARRALQSYGAVHNRGRVEGADPAQLIALLFDAGLDALRSAEAQLARGAWREKCASLEKASEIILALRDSLDLERGGERRAIPQVGLSGGEGELNLTPLLTRSLADERAHPPAE